MCNKRHGLLKKNYNSADTAWAMYRRPCLTASNTVKIVGKDMVGNKVFTEYANKTDATG